MAACGVWRSGRAARSSRGGARRRRAAVCGRPGTGDIVACVASRGAAGFVAGAPALRESGACVPFERDEGLRPLRRVRGAASVRLGAVEPRSTTRRRHRCHSSAGEPLVPRLTDSAVARLLWGTSEQRQRRRVSVTSSEGVYGVLSVTKTQRPTMGNARLAKLNDRVEKTGSGFTRWPQNSRSLPHQGTPEHSKVPLRHLRRKKPRFLNSKRAAGHRRTTHYTNTAYYTSATLSPTPRPSSPAGPSASHAASTHLP